MNEYNSETVIIIYKPQHVTTKLTVKNEDLSQNMIDEYSFKKGKRKQL